MKLYKRYVDVLVLMNQEGKMIPKALVWDHGMTYPIDRILSVKKATSKVGGCGVRYQCRIQGVVRDLFFERDRWFIESTKQ